MHYKKKKPTNAKNTTPADKQKKRATLFDWLVRIGFPAFLIIGSRLYLGPITRARGRMDEATSFAMMLLIILIIERIKPRILRAGLLLFTGGYFVLFHLVYGLYYRFFNCQLPFDITRPWKDLFVVGGYG